MAKLQVGELAFLCADQEELIKQLQAWKRIPQECDYKCPKYGSNLKIKKNEKFQEGYMWYCGNFEIKPKQKNKRKYCGTQVSIRTGSFFAKSRLSIYQILQFVNLWVWNMQIVAMESLIGICSRTANDWASFFREVVAVHFLSNPETIGEATWRAVKAVTRLGHKKGNLFGHLAKYIFLKRCWIQRLNRTEEFLRLAGELYNPLNHRNVVDLPQLKEREEGEEGEDEEEQLFGD